MLLPLLMMAVIVLLLPLVTASHFYHAFDSVFTSIRTNEKKTTTNNIPSVGKCAQALHYSTRKHTRCGHSSLFRFFGSFLSLKQNTLDVNKFSLFLLYFLVFFACLLFSLFFGFEFYFCCVCCCPVVLTGLHCNTARAVYVAFVTDVVASLGFGSPFAFVFSLRALVARKKKRVYH